MAVGTLALSTAPAAAEIPCPTGSPCEIPGVEDLPEPSLCYLSVTANISPGGGTLPFGTRPMKGYGYGWVYCSDVPTVWIMVEFKGGGGTAKPASPGIGSGPCCNQTAQTSTGEYHVSAGADFCGVANAWSTGPGGLDTACG